MTSALARRARAVPTPRPSRPTGVDACLAHLDEAIDAARSLGLDVDDAAAVRDEAKARLGLTADAYVLALVGGTGVGKSSLLNALAGQQVSPAGPRRPTTDRPVAWVATETSDLVEPLLARLGVDERRVHDGGGLEDVAIVDLPDIDSLASEHRARVEELLPRVDAVVWVTDPEKYHDAVLHDAFLHAWLPRLDRQLVVLNKIDRLAPQDVERVRRDLAADLGPGRVQGVRHPAEVVVTSAVDGFVGVGELQNWLVTHADAKRIVVTRLGAAARAAVDDLARRAGADPVEGARTLVAAPDRARALTATIEAMLHLVDLGAVERQAVAATRARARARGTGPLGLLTSAVYRFSGREARVADPGRYVAAWRERGSLARVVEPLRTAVAGAIPSAPPTLRPAVAASVESGALSGRLAHAVDNAIADQLPFAAPSSRVWPILGTLQTLNVLLLVFSLAWLIVWLIGRPPVDMVELPIVGRLPVPFALLCAGLLAGLVLGRAIGIHAGWVGRRWARRLGGRIAEGIEAAVGGAAFAALDEVEASRRALWRAAREMGSCPGG